MKLIRQLRCIFADILFLLCSPSVKAAINDDVKRYAKWNNSLKRISNPLLRLNLLLLSKPEFRSVFCFRTGRRRFFSTLNRLCLPKAEAVEISGDIGAGLFVSHLHSVICPEKSARNLRVGPGAVICGDDDGSPVLGNNVYVASNAVVVGKLSIGDNVLIGAGSVVTHDLGSDAVYVGNPAHLVKKLKEGDALLEEIK